MNNINIVKYYLHILEQKIYIVSVDNIILRLWITILYFKLKSF